MKLPFRRQPKRDLAAENARLFAKNIMMLIELETIAEDPDSERAKEIIAKYKLKIEQRKEQDLMEQN